MAAKIVSASTDGGSVTVVKLQDPPPGVAPAIVTVAVWLAAQASGWLGVKLTTRVAASYADVPATDPAGLVTLNAGVALGTADSCAVIVRVGSTPLAPAAGVVVVTVTGGGGGGGGGAAAVVNEKVPLAKGVPETETVAV